MAAARDRLLTVRMREEELERLARLSEHYGISSSEVIRFLLKKEVDALGMRDRSKKTSR